MNRVKVQADEQKGIERMELALQFIYNIIITVLMIVQHEHAMILFILWGAWVVNLGLILTSVRDYNFRAITASLLSQFAFMLWTMQASDLFFVMPLFLSMVIVLGIYGITEIIGITAISSTCIFFFHVGILGSIQISDRQKLYQLILLIFSTYLIEFFMSFLIRKRLEGVERQTQIIRNLREAERSKDDFLANISHELRTPINTISGMSEIILRVDLPADIKEDLLCIQTAGRNLLSVVSDILDFTELQTAKIPLAEETYNITSTLNDVINMSMALRDQKKIELIIDCDAGIPSGLIGDEQKLRRVIMNLVDNAMKFTGEGCVVISVSHRKTDYGINLIVDVKDTGIGMKDESLEKLFSNFNQVDTKRNRQEGGIGLGLPISRAIVDTMGGFIRVRSIFGKGTRVQFVIPQKVADHTPITTIHNPEQYHIIVYINMEQFERQEIRDAYNECVGHMIYQLGVPTHVCQNLSELKRRIEREHYTQVFISLLEYQEDTSYFDELADKMMLFLIIDRPDDQKVTNPKIKKIYKPLFVLPIVMFMNGEHLSQNIDVNDYHGERFVAPDAHILVVDDNLMNIRVLEGLVRPYQLKISMALSGMEALEKIERMDYDLVFMDHMMPEMDGVETLHRIRNKRGNYFKKIPIIALTANAMSGMREVFLKAGFQDFVAKPIEIAVLERVLKRHLPQEKIFPVKETEKAVQQQSENVPVKTEKLESIGSNQIENETENELHLDSSLFNVQKGLNYCGGLQNYIEILQFHFGDGQENIKKITNLFESEDWKNYTIVVHALKSSMMSIGAVQLSEMAKQLEKAGKAGDSDYIIQNHKAMMEEYQKVLEHLAQNPQINRQAEQDENEQDGLPVMTEDEFDNFAAELEDAAYSFDEEKMLAIVQKMQEYRFKGRELTEVLKPIVKKIQMSDYISAAETVAKLKDK